MNDPGLSPSVLIVEDDAHLAHGMGEVLKRQRLNVDLAGSGEEALERFRRRHYDVVVTDWRLPGMNGDALIVELKEENPQTPILLITGYASVDSAIHCLRNGVCDYLTKPVTADALADHVKRLLPDGPTEGADLVAEDPATRGALALARRVTDSDATILLEAESGAGKEVFARWIHDRGPRATRPFVAVNCAAIPRELLEAELFGHTRGAFTGAQRDRIGLFREADGGTLLLDEIGEMAPDLQARLLRILQDRRVRPLGTDRTVAVDVRFIAATHRDLAAAVRDGSFREDLYYRIRVLPIRIPPLRERPGDLQPLTRMLLARHAGRPVELTDAALRRLQAHDWPGNVRELENVLRRALVLAPGATLDDSAIQFDPLPAAASTDAAIWSLADAEREAIRRSLSRSRGNRQLAADLLGIAPRTLRHKLKQLRDAGRPLELDGDPRGDAETSADDDGGTLPPPGNTLPPRTDDSPRETRFASCNRPSRTQPPRNEPGELVGDRER